MKPTSSPVTDDHPISLTVLVVIADARKSTRVTEVGREQSFVATPEAFAAMPSQLHLLIRAVAGDAQKELNKFLKLLAEPEPAVEEPPQASACPEPETPAAEQTLEPPAEPPAPAEDYLTPWALPLLL